MSGSVEQERSCRECGGEGRNEVLGVGWYCDAHVPTRDEALALIERVEFVSGLDRETIDRLGGLPETSEEAAWQAAAGRRSTLAAIDDCPHCGRQVSALPALRKQVQHLTAAIRIDPTLDHVCNGEGDDPNCDECRYLAAVKEALNG